MASLARHRNGWAIQWTEGLDRKTIYTGQLTKKQATTVRVHVEALVTAAKSQTSIPDATSAWVAGIDPLFRTKLFKHGLIEKPLEGQGQASILLHDFVKRYIQNQASVKETTKTVWKRCSRLMLRYFGPDFKLDQIGIGEAKDFRNWMLREGTTQNQGLAENTVRKMCSIASQIFADAVDRDLVTRNPFRHKDVPRSTRENRERDHFVSRETAEQVLEACPDSQWRLLFALSRYGGLRCPSEHLSLKWRDILWDQNRFVVTSPKTAHHQGKGARVVPIFPELLPYLQESFEQAEDGAEHVITRYRLSNINLRTQLERIILMAGIEPWPKLFHNLRASRETELAAEHPLHVVCGWIGNSPVVAARHYLTTTEGDFERATQRKSTAKSTAFSSQKIESEDQTSNSD